MTPFQRIMAKTSLLLVFAGLSSGASAGGDRDCFSILEDTPALSATYPKRIAHGIHSLTLADLRYYFNPNANETNNINNYNHNHYHYNNNHHYHHHYHYHHHNHYHNYSHYNYFNYHNDYHNHYHHYHHYHH